jgi:hypothetical protein
MAAIKQIFKFFIPITIKLNQLYIIHKKGCLIRRLPVKADGRTNNLVTKLNQSNIIFLIFPGYIKPTLRQRTALYCII